MKAISYMLDPEPDTSPNVAENTNDQNEEITTIRRRPQLADRLSTMGADGSLAPVALDEDACNAFDRRPPLEAMATLWLTRSSVVTVYDLGHDGDEQHGVYDAVFRLHGYVWIRSRGPVLRDDGFD